MRNALICACFGVSQTQTVDHPETGTALHLAVTERDWERALALVKAGTDLNLIDHVRVACNAWLCARLHGSRTLTHDAHGEVCQKGRPAMELARGQGSSKFLKSVRTFLLETARAQQEELKASKAALGQREDRVEQLETELSAARRNVACTCQIPWALFGAFIALLPHRRCFVFVSSTCALLTLTVQCPCSAQQHI
mgnify:CR=1 FL=1